MNKWSYLKELGLESWIEPVSDWIEHGQVNPKSAERAIRNFVKYLVDTDSAIEWNQVSRSRHVHNLKEDGFTFRDWIIKNVKSDHGKNDVIFHLQKFYDYQILRMQSADLGFSYVNPIDFKWDKFKVITRTGSIRKALPLEIIEEMRRILIEKDFQWSKQNFQSDYIKRIINYETGEIDENVFSLSTTLILYVLLTIPLRGLQAQLLDSGERDEWRYDFKTEMMIKNPKGEKGRQEGFIRKVFYSGASGVERESLWITTNKSAGCGYEIPWISRELIRIIGLHVEFLRKYSPNSEKVDKSVVKNNVINKNYPKFYCLFRDLCVDKSKPVSKNKIYRLWGLLCLETEKRLKSQGLDFKLTNGIKNGRVVLLYDLHSLRVSGVTNAIEDKGISLETVSRYLVSHGDIKMTQYYQKGKSLRQLVQASQEDSGHNFRFGLKQLKEK